MHLAACRRGDGMPTDGESLMTLIASCGGSGSNAVASVSAMRDASQTLFVRVGALRRSGKGQGTGGDFTAADAKREGDLLAKIFNTALKQQTALKEGQDEAAKQLLSTAEHALGLLHEMAPHLAFMPTDLDKLSQNLIQKLIDRGLGKRLCRAAGRVFETAGRGISGEDCRRAPGWASGRRDALGAAAGECRLL